jgi:hypothetical protein
MPSIPLKASYNIDCLVWADRRNVLWTVWKVLQLLQSTESAFLDERIAVFNGGRASEDTVLDGVSA